jgi:hypothetical protein
LSRVREAAARLSRLRAGLSGAASLESLRRLELVQEALGRAEIRRLLDGPRLPHVRDYGVRVFAQWDEDGIIAYLLDALGDFPRQFVEIGVEDYSEANTRFLLRQGDWSGVVVEADPKHASRIQERQEAWRYDVRIVHAFVTRANVDDLIAAAGFRGDIGVLSIDIDGNDYWIWQAVSVVSPYVVVVEYNGRLGPERSVSIPYEPGFRRMAASATGIYYGASLAAFVGLGAEKGYDYVGSNGADTNAFFVRSDLRPAWLPRLTASEGFRPPRLREMRDPSGRLTLAGPDEEVAVLSRLPFVDV